jgi:hypothetical protein
MLKNPAITWKSDCLAKFDQLLLAHNSNRGLSRRLVWSASGDERGTKTGFRVQTVSKAEMREAGFPPSPKIEEDGRGRLFVGVHV